MPDRYTASRTVPRIGHGRNPTRDLLAVAVTVLLANTPTLFAFYVAVDTYNSASTGFFRHITTTMSGALIFAVLWTGIVYFAFGPALASAWSER